MKITRARLLKTFAKGSKTKLARSALLASAIALAWWLLLFRVPQNMDELSYYHSLACGTAPVSMQFNHYREPCSGENELRTTYGLRFERAYGYIGVLPSAAYMPLYNLWPSPHSARLWGAMAFALFLLLSCFWPGATPRVALAIAGTSLPIAYQMIADTGPVAFHVNALAALPIWGFAQAGHAVYAAIVSVLALEEKAFFIYLLPAIPLLSFFVKRAPKRNYLIWFSFTALGAYLLFSMRDETGHSYWYQLRHTTGEESPLSRLLTKKGLKDWFFLSKGLLLTYFGNWASFAHRVLGKAPAWYVVPSLVALGSGLGALGLVSRRFLLTAVALVFVAFLPMTLNPLTAAGHHMVFPMSVFTLLVVHALSTQWKKKRRWAARLLGAWVLAQLALVSFVFVAEPLPASAAERAELLKLIEQRYAKTHWVSHQDWGTYYWGSLYGPTERLVTFNEPNYWEPAEHRQNNKLDPADLKAAGRPLIAVRRTQESRVPMSFLQGKPYSWRSQKLVWRGNFWEAWEYR